MGKQRSPQQPSAGATVTGGAGKKGVTPPKGRPTRARNGSGSTKRVFGPVAQWITAAVVIVLIVVVLVLVTDGGDFNPFNDQNLPSQFGAPAAASPDAS
jgi:hypothetical protein